MDHIRGAGRRAIYSWTYEGTNTAQVGTGNAVRFSGWEAWTFSDEGLVQESIGTFDVDEYSASWPTASNNEVNHESS